MHTVDATIETMIRQVAAQDERVLPAFDKRTALVEELGFTSWTIVDLLGRLEELLGVDPLDDEIMVSSVRTVGDLCSLYESSLARAE